MDHVGIYNGQSSEVIPSGAREVEVGVSRFIRSTLPANKRLQRRHPMRTLRPCVTIATGVAILWSGLLLANPIYAAQDVAVNNTATNPVQARDVDNPGRQPFSFGILGTLNAGQPFLLIDVTTVPAGKRLVIEYVNMEAQVIPGQKVLTRLFSTGASGNISLFAPFQAKIGFFDVLIASHLIKHYAEPGSTVKLQVFADESLGGAGIAISIVGHLIDLP